MGHLATMAVLALNGSNGVDKAATIRGVVEERGEVGPTVFPQANSHCISATPLVGQFQQASFKGLTGQGLIDGFEGIVDLMDNIALGIAERMAFLKPVSPSTLAMKSKRRDLI